MTKINILNKIYVTLAIISFFVMLGTVGALECNKISFTQSIAQGSISMFSLYFFAKLAGAFKQPQDIEIDQYEILNQINHHIPINGYRVFTERQSGTRYTMTLLSNNNRRCVLAELEDYTDPQATLKIISF